MPVWVGMGEFYLLTPGTGGGLSERVAEEGALTWVKGTLSQMAFCHACLAALATGWEEAPWGAVAAAACWVHRAAPPNLHASWIQGSSKHVLHRLVAAGAGSGTPHRPLPSSAAAVGSTGMVLTFCSPAPSLRQKRGAKIVDLTGKGRRSGQCCRKCF